jgi:hypothetical protein
MISNIQNQNFGYSVAVDSIWAAVGNPSLLRYNSLTSSLIRTGSVEIFKYNINTDTHDLKTTLYRMSSNTELVFLTTEYNTSSILITSDSILHTEYTGTVPITADLDIIVDKGTYFTASEDGYGYSVDIKGDILAVGCPYFRNDLSLSNTQSHTFYGSGSVDIFDLSKLNIDPYANRIPPTIVSSSFVGSFDLINVLVPSRQNYRFVFLQSKNVGDPVSSYQTIAVANTSNLGGIVSIQTNYTISNLTNIDLRVIGVVGSDPYMTTIYNPHPDSSGSFGYSISLNDEWLAVGSPLESGSKGDVFLFQNGGSPDSWSFYQSITPPSGEIYFGHSVELNKASGSYSGSLVVGTLKSSGSYVYEYEFDGTNWNYMFTLKPDNTTKYPLTFYPTLPIFSGSFPNTSDSFGFDVGFYQDTIIVGAPTDRSIYEYSGSQVYQQGAVYFFQRCPNPSVGYYMARKSYGNENIMKNNMLGYSVSIYDQYAVAGIPKINSESASICYLQGSLFQNNFCGDSTEETLNGQYALYNKTVGTLPNTSFIDWDITNIYQIRKKYFSPYRSFGWDIDISNQFVIVGSPMLIYGQNTVMSFFNDTPFGPIVLSVSSGSAILNWTYTDAEQDGFNIEKSTDGNTFNNIDILSNSISRSYTDTNVSMNNTYWYRINAYNELGVSEYSNIANIFFAPPPPSGPTVLTVTTGSVYSQSLGSGSSILTWTYADTYQIGFRVDKSSSVSPNFFNIAVVPDSAARTYIDSSSIDANNTYWYRVQPYNGIGTGSYSNSESASFSNVLYFSGSEKYYVNPTGYINESNQSWKGCFGYKNINLSNLNVSENLLTTLNLVSASVLTTLNCNFNRLTSLDVDGDANLADLSCQNNLLTTLDVRNNHALQVLNGNNNLLSTLYISGSPAYYVTVDGNQLTTSSVNFKQCLNISSLLIDDNLFNTIDIGPCSASLITLGISINPLDNGFFDATPYVNMSTLYASNDGLVSIDLTQCPLLTNVELYGNSFSTVDFSYCPQLLREDVSINSNLQWLDLSNNPLCHLIGAHETYALTHLSASISSSYVTILGDVSIPVTGTASMNQLYLNLDGNGLYNGTISALGTLAISGSQALAARTSLISKGWNIDDTYGILTYNPSSSLIKWNDKNGSHSPTDLYTFWATSESSSVTEIHVGSGSNGGDKLISINGLQYLPSLKTASVYGNSLTVLNVVNCFSMSYLSGSDNLIGSSQIDYTLVELVTNGVFNGSVYLNKQTPLAPATTPGNGAPDGRAALASLKSSGWTVITD